MPDYDLDKRDKFDSGPVDHDPDPVIFYLWRLPADSSKEPERMELRVYDERPGVILDMLQDAVDGFIEPVWLPEPVMFEGEPCEVYANEEGLLNNLPPNGRGMDLCDWEGIVPLVGDIALVPLKCSHRI